MNSKTAKLLRRTANDYSLTAGGRPVTATQLKRIWHATPERDRGRFRKRLWKTRSPRITRRWWRLAMASIGHWPV